MEVSRNRNHLCFVVNAEKHHLGTPFRYGRTEALIEIVRVIDHLRSSFLTVLIDLRGQTFWSEELILRRGTQKCLAEEALSLAGGTL